MVHPKRRRSASKNQTNPDVTTSSHVPAFGNHANNITEEAYQRVVNEVEDYAFLLLELNGKIISWNKGAEKLKGYSADEIIGKNYRIFYSKEDKAQQLPETLLSEAVKNGKINYEGWRIKKNGTRFWGSISLTAIHDDQGAARGFLKITKDLTEKKRTEDQFSNYVEELKLKNEELKKSEERYHKMVSEVVDYAIILLDKEGKILDWNKGAEALKGYTPAEIIGKSFRLFYSKEDKHAELPDTLLRAATKNGHVSHEGWRIRKDGVRFWGSVAITALHDDNGDLIGFSKVTRDLTERKIAEDQLVNFAEALKQKNEELLISEERYHRMIAEIKDYAIILLNTNGDIQNWNRGAELIKGYEAKEIVGKNFRAFYPKEDREAKLPEKLLREAMKNGKAVHDGWRVRKDGSTFWGNIVITALHDDSGEVVGFSKVTRDLTEKKRADDALQASAAQLELKNKNLERLNNELSSFTYVASHDLKEPLRKIQSFASLLEKQTGFPDSGTAYLDKIKNGASRMQYLIEDLLSYSQVSNDKSNFERVDLNEVLQGVKNDLELIIQEKNAVIESNKLPVLQGVRFQLYQVLLNLLSNALKFAKAGERSLIKIHVKVIKGPDLPENLSTTSTKYYQLNISDNGIGFDPVYSNKIFDPFERLHPKKDFAGTGIGLAIVKKVVQNHNGIIEAEGRPNEGSTFRLYFPYTNK